MGAVPKTRISKARRGGRRSHQALTPPQLVQCPQCREPRLPHQVCPSCGYYKGVEVVKAKAKPE
ncbi:MAG TPA: 50S ribosomal protein L32 [Anaerolineae bacterium]|nr:50S ribosomal protein L32 [Anaerolineae bacterium]